MPDPSFAQAHDGSMTASVGLTTLKVYRATAVKRFNVFDVTGSGDGRVAKYEPGNRYHWYLTMLGWFITAADTYAKPPATATTGTPFARVYSATIIKRNIVKNATAAPDALDVGYFELGQTSYHGACVGPKLDTEKILGTENDGKIASLIFPVTGSLVVSGAAVIDNFDEVSDFRAGGPVESRMNFRYTGAMTVTSTPLASDSFTAALNLDNGETMGGTVKIQSMRLGIDYRQGAIVGVQLSGPFHGAVTFT